MSGSGDDRTRRGRQRRAHPWWEGAAADPVEERGHAEESSDLHEERLDAVARVLLREGVSTVLDLGCGAGSLLRRLAREAAYSRLTGVDLSIAALRTAERVLAPFRAAEAPRIDLLHGSILEHSAEWPAADAAVLVETIEHLPPDELSRLEGAVLAGLRPRLVVITTPNRECNPLLGIPDGRLRHPDHRFEWGRTKFEAWAAGLGSRHGYAAAFEGIGPGDAWHGRATQMAVLRRLDG
jgi:small RNA 2'-O-methyltransferase